MKINPIGSPVIPSIQPSAKSAKINGAGFSAKLKKAVEEVNTLQQKADQSIEQVVQGNLGVHEGMLALGKADISLKLLLQVRNKVIEAYREINRMQF